MDSAILLEQVADHAVRCLLADLLDRVAALEAPATAGLAAPVAAVSGVDALALALNGRLASVLLAGGYGSPQAVAAASDDALLAVAGINTKALKMIRERIKGE